MISYVVEEVPVYRNPRVMVPVVVLGVAGVATAGWIGWRFSQRARLRKLLAANPETLALGTPEDLAAAEITIFSATSADEAYADIVSRLPEARGPVLVEQIGKLAQQFVPEDVAKEGTEFATSVWEAGKTWWEGK